jgi:D-hydroxyproline dehydrogenase subunit beta
MPAHPRYSDRLPASADLVVVGGGVIGAATAFFASRHGLSVVLIEKRAALCTLTSAASTGAFRLQFDNPEEIALVREGIEVFLNFGAVTGTGMDLDLRQQGYLFCATSEAGAGRQKAWVAEQHAWGVSDVELIPGDEVRRRFPHIGPAVIQSRFRADDGWLDANKLTLGYAAGSGAAICLETTVTGFKRENGRVVGVETSRGAIGCGHVAIAAGPFSARIAEKAGVTIELRPTIRQKLILPEVPEVPPGAPMTIEEETAAHWRPALRGAFGIFTDPSVPPGEPLEEVPTNSDFALRLLNPASPVALARVSPFWARVWERGTANWVLQAGQYDYTRDHRPLLGPTAIGGVHLNTGYSGHGVMAGTAGSRIVADLLVGRMSQNDNPFRYDRPMAERTLDIL